MDRSKFRGDLGSSRKACLDKSLLYQFNMAPPFSFLVLFVSFFLPLSFFVLLIPTPTLSLLSIFCIQNTRLLQAFLPLRSTCQSSQCKQVLNLSKAIFPLLHFFLNVPLIKCTVFVVQAMVLYLGFDATW